MICKSIAHIAFLGPKGSYSHLATMQYANRYFDKITEYSCRKFNDVFSLVESNNAEYGVVPIENSNSGLIDEVCNLLLNTQILLLDEITIPIKHCLLVNNNTNNIDKIQIIYSHPQPIQQCSKFLKYFSKWKIIFCESSSVAMQTIAKSNQPNLAALGSIEGGAFYGLHALLKYNLSNSQKNTTRFFVFKKKNIKVIKKYVTTKTTFIVSIEQQSKKLYEILKILQYYSIKVTYFRSHLLLCNTTENVIIINIIAYIYNIYMQQAFIELKKNSHSLKILSYYPIISNKKK